MNVEVDKTGWTIYEPALCECVDTKLAKIRVAGGVKDVFVLELIALDIGRVIIKYFNVKKSRSGNYAVSSKSDFAKLYRLTLGTNPAARFSRANQLLGHLRGQQFVVDYEEAKSSSNGLYYRATKIKSVDPIVTNEWFSSGVLKGKSRAKTKQKIDNQLAKSWQKSSKNLAKAIPVKAAKQLGLSSDFNPIQHTTYKVKPLSHTNMKVISDKEVAYWYEQQPEEDLCSYFDRVIEDSF